MNVFLSVVTYSDSPDKLAICAGKWNDHYSSETQPEPEFGCDEEWVIKDCPVLTGNLEF